MLTSMRVTSVRRQEWGPAGGNVDESEEIPHRRSVCRDRRVARGLMNCSAGRQRCLEGEMEDDSLG
jgi:hypothetical protein